MCLFISIISFFLFFFHFRCWSSLFFFFFFWLSDWNIYRERESEGEGDWLLIKT